MSHKITFIKEPDEVSYSYDTTTVKFETRDVVMTDLLVTFENFLRACGFVFDGNLIVDEKETK